MNSKTKLVIKIVAIIGVFALLCLAVYLPLKLTGVLDKFDSIEEIKDYITSKGVLSYLIFFALQFAQCTIIPIPAIITTVAGSLVFGPWISFAISFVAIMLGSVLSFLIGKLAAKSFVEKIVGKESMEKWSKKINRGKYVYFFMMLFPFFPDDILCLVVGASSMTWRFFIMTNLITRPPTLLLICFLGSGALIPFAGWGIWIWLAFGIVAIVSLVLSYIYKDAIENFVVNFARKFNKKRKN